MAVSDSWRKSHRLHGRVVANQNNTVPIEVGMMKGISRGRPASPASSPIAGIQTPPTVVSRCIAGSDAEAGQPILHANKSPTSHKMRLTTGVDNPTRLARARQSELFGACRYFTTPHSQMKGVLRPMIVITAQKSTKQWYFRFPLKVEITFERTTGVISPLHSKCPEQGL
jgi:hypothetical protein